MSSWKHIFLGRVKAHKFLVSDCSLTKDIMSVHGIVFYLKSGRMWILLVANMELQLKMEWAVLIVKPHQMSISYGTWSSRTCMSKQGALSIRKKRIGERTTSSGIQYGWSSWGMSIGKSKEHRTEAKIWLTLLSLFRWYVWISTDQLMSCLQTKLDIFLRWSLTPLDSFVLFVCVRRTRRHKWRLIKMNPDHW